MARRNRCAVAENVPLLVNNAGRVIILKGSCRNQSYPDESRVGREIPMSRPTENFTGRGRVGMAKIGRMNFTIGSDKSRVGFGKSKAVGWEMITRLRGL